MPRDLAAMSKEATMDSMPSLNRENAPNSLPPEITTSPEAQYDDDDLEGDGETGDSLLGRIGAQLNPKRDELHPYTQTLTLNDVESCVRLEAATFPEHERCSREKVSLSHRFCFSVLRACLDSDKLVVRCAVCVVSNFSSTSTALHTYPNSVGRYEARETLPYQRANSSSRRNTTVLPLPHSPCVGHQHRLHSDLPTPTCACVTRRFFLPTSSL